MNINKGIFAGRIGNIETTATQSGMHIVTMRVCTNKKIKDGEKALWLTAKAFGKLAETLSTYFSKGDPIYFDYSLDVNEWTDKEGKKHNDVQLIVQSFEFYPKSSKTETASQTQPSANDNLVEDFDDAIDF